MSEALDQGNKMDTTTKTEIKRISNGYFEVKVEGVLKYSITNGDRGCSGRNSNFYVAYSLETEKYHHLGSLANAKRTVLGWIKLAARKQAREAVA